MRFEIYSNYCGRKTFYTAFSNFSIFFINVDGARKIPSLSQSFSKYFFFVGFSFRTFQFWQIYSLFHQRNFFEAPVVLVTSEHLKTGQDYDAALIWNEDVTSSSFQVCPLELQNFEGKHDEISVVCVRSKTRGIFIALKLKERTVESFLLLKLSLSRVLWATGTCRYNSPASRPTNRRSTQLYGNSSDAMGNYTTGWSKLLKWSQFPGYESSGTSGSSKSSKSIDWDHQDDPDEYMETELYLTIFRIYQFVQIQFNSIHFHELLVNYEIKSSSYASKGSKCLLWIKRRFDPRNT